MSDESLLGFAERRLIHRIVLSVVANFGKRDRHVRLIDLVTLSDDDPASGVIRWLVSCDETGVHGSRFYGFGTLWMGWQRRGDFSKLLLQLREEHGYPFEIKWTKVSAWALPFYEDLVEQFFRAPWLSFQCCLVEKAVVRKEFHNGDYDLARRKHFGMLLSNKIKACIRAHPGREQTFRVLVDPINSRYSKADEAAEVICNNV